MERLPRSGGYLLSVAHVSHLDPVAVSLRWPRRVSWLARLEFYRHAWTATVMRAAGAIPVDRFGYARAPLVEAARRVRDGEVVGIFPEGEIMRGENSVVRGGSLRGGAAWIAARAQCVVVPVVIAGTDTLGKIGPWLPAKRGRLWLGVGAPVPPPASARLRQERADFSNQLGGAMRSVFDEMRGTFALGEDVIP
jgi:1-acyl-sn-glycerol-3-phosphate acyltransferase